MSNDGITSVKVASIYNNKINKKQDKIEEDNNNEIVTDIINYLEELEKIQDDHLNTTIRCKGADYHIKAISESRVLIAKIKEIIKIMTLKNLFNKISKTDSHDVTINYYCQDPSQYPTPNMENAHVDIVYHDKE